MRIWKGTQVGGALLLYISACVAVAVPLELHIYISLVRQPEPVLTCRDLENYSVSHLYRAMVLTLWVTVPLRVA